MNVRRAVVLIGSVAVVACGGGGFAEDLHHPTPAKRVAAAEFLGAQREAKAVPDLERALRDSVAEVRAKVAWALGMIRARETRQALTGMLGDPSRRVRQSVIWAITQLEEPEALPALRAALSVEKDVWVRTDLEQAIDYLAQFEGEDDVNEADFR